MCKLNLPIQWVYDKLDCFLCVPPRVEHYKFAALHAKYEQNPIKIADIDIKAYIHALDLAFIYEYIRGIDQDLLKGIGYHYIVFL